MQHTFETQFNGSKPSQRVVLAGACGMGMLPLAILLKQTGVDVVALDDVINPRVVSYFEKLKIPFSTENQLPDCDVLIHTSAIKPAHLLYQQALERKVRIYRRGEYFAEFVKNKKLIAIVGSHGKTTTTALLIKILRHVGFDCSYYLGGLFQDQELLPAHYSNTSDWLIAEVDESDGTIQSFVPEMTVLLNLSWDHSSFYSDVAQLYQTFNRLLERTKSNVFIGADESSLRFLKLPDASKISSCSFKNTSEASFHAGCKKGELGFLQIDLIRGFHQCETVKTQLHGDFNAANALISLSVATTLTEKSLAGTLEGFCGVSRRQEILYSDDSRVVITDYAHHPNEVAAFLHFAQQKFVGKKLITVFQPHRYSRTRQYASEFAEVLSVMSSVHLLPVYCASEMECEDGKSERIYERMQQTHEDVTFWEERQLLLAFLQSTFVENTVILFVGAGDVEQLARIFSSKYVGKMSSSEQLSA